MAQAAIAAPGTRLTALGTLMVGLAGTGFAAALALGTLAPALLGLLLVGCAEGARRSLIDAPVHVERRLPKRAHLGDPFTVTTVATGPADHPLRVQDPVPGACFQEQRDHHQGRGMARESLVLSPRHPGTIQWRETRVEMDDPWSLWARDLRIPHPDRLKVTPEPVWGSTGRLLARRNPSLGRRRSRFELDPSPEIARIREHREGDRVRDIDWKRSSRSDRLHVRETERQGRRAVHLFVDMSRPMRWARHHAKATTVMRLLHGVGGLARAAGLPVHLVAYHEYGVIEAHIQRGDALVRALDRLADLPVPTATAPLPDAPTPRVPPTRAEHDFLTQSAVLVQGPWPREPSDQAALLALTGRRTSLGLVIAFLDAEADPAGTLQKVHRLRNHGHQVVLVVPPTGIHLYHRDEAEGEVLIRLKDHLQARQEVLHAMRRLKVPVLLAAPGEERDILKEVSRRLR